MHGWCPWVGLKNQNAAAVASQVLNPLSVIVFAPNAAAEPLGVDLLALWWISKVLGSWKQLGWSFLSELWIFTMSLKEGDVVTVLIRVDFSLYGFDRMSDTPIEP